VDKSQRIGVIHRQMRALIKSDFGKGFISGVFLG